MTTLASGPDGRKPSAAVPSVPAEPECLDSLGRPIPHMRDWVPAYRLTAEQREAAVKAVIERRETAAALNGDTANGPKSATNGHPASPEGGNPPKAVEAALGAVPDEPDDEGGDKTGGDGTGGDGTDEGGICGICGNPSPDDDALCAECAEPDIPLPVPSPEPEPVSWDVWRKRYETRRDRPDGYSANKVRLRILKAIPDARVFPIHYRPGREVRGQLSELDRPTGWQTTTPGGMKIDIPKFQDAALIGIVLEDLWDVIDVDNPEEAEQAGITPAVLIEAGAMIVLTPSGGCHAIFKNNPNRKTKRAIRPVEGVDYLTGKAYIYAPYSWRPEHQQAGRIKPAGTYHPIWDKFEPVQLPEKLFRLVFPKRSATSSETHHQKRDEPKPQWAELQDAAVKIRQAFPKITAEAAADILWQQHRKEGFLPNLNPAWPWTKEEMTNRIRNAWTNRDNYEAEQERQSPQSENRRNASPKSGNKRGWLNAPPDWAAGWE